MLMDANGRIYSIVTERLQCTGYPPEKKTVADNAMRHAMNNLTTTSVTQRWVSEL